ncbi:chaperonin 10-like protein [Dactylonectria estremocensis]|uniref:alcohol dehydrogenase n=1 Tax=Dactylonectria estremocensis TaxID=1079267 RepID=A0A9P9DR41_9HYPO|nr:chaperonin 10-like protein [Dactylonectria estremocensis]
MFELREARLPLTQRAVVTPQMGSELNLRCCTIDVRKAAVGEVTVRILYTGICRSDACFSVGPEEGYPTHDHIAGHEGIGHVVRSQDPTLLGKLVALRYLGASCESCIYCLRGLPTSCPHQLNLPKHVQGTFQQYVTAPVSCLLPIPDSFVQCEADIAALTSALCSGSTALKALKEADACAKEVVVVIGIAGGIGHLIGAIAKQVRGARVIGTDLASKLDSLRHSHVADALLEAPRVSSSDARTSFQARLVKTCRKLRGDRTLARAADIVIVAASTGAAFENLEDYVCDGGRIVCVGVPRDVAVSLPVNVLVERNLHLAGTLMGGHEEALEVMEYIVSGRIKPIITQGVLEDVPEQMQKQVNCETIGKAVIRVNGGLDVVSTGCCILQDE